MFRADRPCLDFGRIDAILYTGHAVWKWQLQVHQNSNGKHSLERFKVVWWYSQALAPHVS